MFFLIIVLLSFTDAHFICHSDKTDLCIGYSGLLQNGTKLQLKSRLSLQKKNDTERITWNMLSVKKVKPLFLNGGYFIQPELKRKVLGKVEQKNSIVGLVKRTRVSSISYNKTQCLTIMECEPGKFCDPSPKRYAKKIKKGAYLAFLPCQYNGSRPIYSQSFMSNPPCFPGCLNACDCVDNIYCSLLAQQCFTNNPTSQQNQTTLQPTLQPLNQTTLRPTLQPTNQPTFQPLSQPTIQIPTKQPSDQPSLLVSTKQPTDQPTLLIPTNQPTIQKQPTIQPTIHPTVQNQPLYQPSTNQPTSGILFPLSVSQQVGIGVGVSLCLLIMFTILLCIVFRRNIHNFITDQKPKQESEQAVV
jgi:hypothetical protein